MSSTSTARALPAAPTRPGVPGVLADRLPHSALVSGTAVVVGAALVGLSAQVAVPLPVTPVPFTLQTMVVLLLGAALGPRRGVAATLLYLVAGVVGVPVFAPRAGLTTIGYLAGFVLAAALVGALARRGGDRTVARSAAAMALGDLVILACGSVGLMAVLGVGPGRALLLGAVPFLVGDAVKVAAAALVLPAAWRLVDRPTG